NAGKTETLDYDKTLDEWAYDIIGSGTADIVLLFSKDFKDSFNSERTGTGILFHDATNDESQFIQQRIVEILIEIRKVEILRRVDTHSDLPKGFNRPIFIEQINVASDDKRGGYIAGRILPMLMIVMIMLGAFYPAVDITAGEKERGTMQTLLTAPAMPSEIILGKFFTVFIISMLSALANLGSMALAFVYMFQSQSMDANLNFHLDITTGIILFIQLIPVALLFSALMLAISIFAKSFKEAQNYLTPIYLLVIIPIALTGMPGVKLSDFTAFVPVLNMTLLMKDMFVEPPEFIMIMKVLVANCIFGALALMAAVRIFKTEQVLLGGQNAISDVFGMRTKDGNRLTPTLVVFIYATLLIMFFYIGGIFQSKALISGLIISQYSLLFLPAILIVWKLRISYKTTFSLRKFSIAHLIAVLLMGASSWLVLSGCASFLQNLILPEPEAISKAFKDALGLLDSDKSIWILLLAFAVTPAICEETLFRGVILSGMRQGNKKWAAILITSILFGIFHISIYRIMPTAMIGIVATLIAWETRSIYPAIIFHFMHNGLSISVHKMNWFPSITQDNPSISDNIGLLVTCSVMFIGGLILLMKTKPAETLDSKESES
ncbi:CPBP family intramembrane metalloprotease, partial [bacterium AH-315-E10]|nr:CPBP family intramembrane metalloprotease [bacterium AH-315-E10]